MTLEELITDLKAAGANANTMQLAMNCYELGLNKAIEVGRADFEAYKEGSEEAFRTVVDDKHALQKRVRQLEEAIDAQRSVIVRLREGGVA